MSEVTPFLLLVRQLGLETSYLGANLSSKLSKTSKFSVLKRVFRENFRHPAFSLLKKDAVLENILGLYRVFWAFLIVSERFLMILEGFEQICCVFGTTETQISSIGKLVSDSDFGFNSSQGRVGKVVPTFSDVFKACDFPQGTLDRPNPALVSIGKAHRAPKRPENPAIQNPTGAYIFRPFAGVAISTSILNSCTNKVRKRVEPTH